LADNAYEVRPGWWVDTHASRAGIEARIKMAFGVAGVRYGRDLVVNLGWALFGRAFDDLLDRPNSASI
jgi:hypothetical protein